jgi:hypothetical protein
VKNYLHVKRKDKQTRVALLEQAKKSSSAKEKKKKRKKGKADKRKYD